MTQIVKRVSDPYFITSTDVAVPTILTIGDGAVNLAEVTINGNLVVTGTKTTVNTSDLAITDNKIVLNNGETGNGVTHPSGKSGFEVYRGPNVSLYPSVSIQWNEPALRWQLTNDGTNFVNIATITSSGYISAVVEDLDPHLGGNLVTGHDGLEFRITSLVNKNLILNPDLNLQVDGPIQLEHVPALSTSISGYSLVHGGNVAGGATGVYISSETQMNQELIAKKRAIVYSLIF